MNTNLFVAPTTTDLVTNLAGGKAYSMTDEMALLQLAVTGVFNDTFYATAEDQLKTVQTLVDKCSTEWIARVAIYAREKGYMKDMPAYLVAVLASRPEKNIFNYTFDLVIDNVGMIRNFTQVIRSGVTGRKSLGSAPKHAIARALNKLSADRIFYQSVGTSPSLEDVLKLSHCKPLDAEHDALYGYLLDKPYIAENLPLLVKRFEAYKAGTLLEAPAVDFRRLTALNLTDEQWMDIGIRMTWNQTRMNLNTLARHNCFTSQVFTDTIVKKLQDEGAIAHSKVLPFAIYNAINNVDAAVPASVKQALGWCLDLSLMNAPVLTDDTIILVDTSGSMNSPVTGYRPGATSTMTCTKAAAYFAASILKRNPDRVAILPFDTTVHPIAVNPRDSVETITKQLARGGGGTDVSCGVRHILRTPKYKNILIISDNESWFDGMDSYRGMRSTATQAAWQQYKKARPDARMVCWDITPNTTVQAKNDHSVLNVGGFTEAVYDLVSMWYGVGNAETWRSQVNSIPIQ